MHWAYEQLGKALADQWDESALREDVEAASTVLRKAWEWLKVCAKRGTTAKPTGTDNPFKHMRPHPTDPGKVRFKDPHTGKMLDKPKPPGFDEWFKGKK